MTFFDFKAPSSPLFSRLGILKIFDLIYLHNALFMHDFYTNILPGTLCDFFNPILTGRGGGEALGPHVVSFVSFKQFILRS